MEDLDEIRERKLKELQRKLEGREESAEESTPAPSTPIDVTDKDFDQVAQHHPRLVVDCWAEWCGPCRRIAPIIDQLAGEYAGQVTFAKLNVDDNPRTAQRYQIRSIPTLLFMKNGQVVDQVLGAVPKRQIEQKIRRNLT